MAALFTQTPEFYNDLCDVIRLFIPEKHIVRLYDAELPSSGVTVRHFICRDRVDWASRIELYVDGVLQFEHIDRPTEEDVFGDKKFDYDQDAILAKRIKKHFFKKQLYGVLEHICDRRSPWGALTGIRPIKFLREIAENCGIQTARRMLLEQYFVKPEKIALAEQILNIQRPWIENVRDVDVDIYVGIPFCVSRCKYCSFISQDFVYAAKWKESYLQRLLYEMRSLRDDILRRHMPRALYIGGGTPTALSVDELGTVLSAARELAPNPIEFTVEAGRPDTLDEEKLAMIREHDVGRISINVQTTKNETLRKIGRNHSAEDFFRVFSLARLYGFDSINTDLILGLPGEGVKEALRSLQDVLQVRPENITAHTLSIKNASAFAREERLEELPRPDVTEKTVEAVHRLLIEEGYVPYYLYRQKYMSGNLENVGFTLPGHEGIYNIDVMEETVNNMAFGAGGISKRLFREKNRIERAANVKDVRHYVMRTEEMVQRKKVLFDMG
jgi:coproporphyrinogen dehydrogenase HemZ